MMNRLEAAARQALEALDQIATHVGQYDLPGMPNHITTLATLHRDALRDALAEQQADQPNAVLVEGFGRVAMRKLNDLHEKGYAINGVSIATISEAGETNLGAVTTGGRVLWWPQQAAEPVAASLGDIVAIWDQHAPGEYMTALHMQAKRALAGQQPTSPDKQRWCQYVAGMIAGWLDMLPDQGLPINGDARTQAIAGIIERRLWAMPNDAHPAPTQQPLTMIKRYELWMQATIEPCTHEACYQRGISDAEAAHGITSNEGGAA